MTSPQGAEAPELTRVGPDGFEPSPPVPKTGKAPSPTPGNAASHGDEPNLSHQDGTRKSGSNRQRIYTRIYTGDLGPEFEGLVLEIALETVRGGGA